MCSNKGNAFLLVVSGLLQYALVGSLQDQLLLLSLIHHDAVPPAPPKLKSRLYFGGAFDHSSRDVPRSPKINRNWNFPRSACKKARLSQSDPDQGQAFAKPPSSGSRISDCHAVDIRNRFSRVDSTRHTSRILSNAKTDACASPPPSFSLLGIGYGHPVTPGACV